MFCFVFLFVFSLRPWACRLSQLTEILGRAAGLSAEALASRNPGLSSNKNEKNSASFSCLPGRQVYILDILLNIGKKEPPIWIIEFESHISQEVIHGDLPEGDSVFLGSSYRWTSKKSAGWILEYDTEFGWLISVNCVDVF